MAYAERVDELVPPPIACTLEGDAMPDRLADWQALLRGVVERSEIPGGVRVTFAAGTTAAEVAALAEAEQQCCRFFGFAITVDERGLALELTAPPDAQEIVTALFGVAS